MIQLECSNCKAVLAIDDAFAGGVCRCQQCGTIQTVPKAGQKESSAEPQKALFKRKARIESALSPYSDALDRAADEMDSSGSGLSANALAGAGLRRGSSSPVGDDVPGSSQAGRPSRSGSAAAVATAPAPKTAKATQAQGPTPSKSAHVVLPTKRKGILLASLIGGGVLLIAVAIVIFATSGAKSDASQDESENTLAVAEQGMISGIPLRGETVVFVLDRSGVTQQAFGRMVNMSLKAAESLGSSRKFQLVVWNNHDPLSCPASGPATASLAKLEEARRALTSTYAGSSALTEHLKTALGDGAQDIVILSAVDADEQLADEIDEAMSGSKTRLHAVALGSDLNGDQLRAVAQRFGGQFRQVALDKIN